MDLGLSRGGLRPLPTHRQTVGSVVGARPGNAKTGSSRETPIKERFMKGHDRMAKKLIDRIQKGQSVG
jgi:hypothetical protein